MMAADNDNSRDARLVVNGRYRVHRITGVQRYAHEIVNRLAVELGDDLELRTPDSAKGAVGHLWEQTVLPWKCAGRLLWNPCGSGPIAYRHQVVTFHDLFPLEYPEWYSGPYARWYGFAMRQLSAHATHLIAVSEYTKSRLVTLLGRDPETVTVIHNGLSKSCERASEAQIDEARIALKLPTRRYVLSLSSLESRKNLKGMLAAWAQVHASLPEDTWLVLAGPKADEKVYGKQDLALHLPRVLFTGYVPEEHLAGLYSGASLFVFPSLAEGFGLPLLEAMACGIRCITSKTSSLPEVGGDLVDYIDPLQPAEIARAIQARMTGTADLTKPFLPAIERARQFSWDKAASSTRSVLEAAAETRYPAAQRTRMAGL
jgi:glycosyltransferase involved in cell wall biosynthesis